MIRSAAIACLLFVAFVPAHAQEPAASARTHVVQSGETLGDIARQYLGSAAEWARIYEANRAQIADPNLIRPGMELAIPGASAEPGPATTGPATTVLGIQVDGQGVATVEALPYEARRAMLESRPFTPGPTPPIDIADRTVFYASDGTPLFGPVVMTQGAAEVPAVPEGVFRAAGWIVPENDPSDRLGQILAMADPDAPPPTSVTLRPGTEVEIRFFAEGAPRPGERFLAYSLGAEIPGRGTVAVPSGTVEIVSVGETGTVARVIDGFTRMRVGHFLALPRTFPLPAGVHPSPSDLGTPAQLLGFQDAKELHLPGDFAFIDRGRDAGLVVGDELNGVAEGGELGTARDVARFQVVGVREGTATVRILSVQTPAALKPGLSLVLVAKMP
jgi:LysM repeat protein